MLKFIQDQSNIPNLYPSEYFIQCNDQSLYPILKSAFNDNLTVGELFSKCASYVNPSDKINFKYAQIFNNKYFSASMGEFSVFFDPNKRIFYKKKSITIYGNKLNDVHEIISINIKKCFDPVNNLLVFDVKKPITELQNSNYSLSVVSLTGVKYIIHPKPNDYILDVKNLIEHEHGIPVCQQRLIHGGRQLEDDQTLSNYNIETHSFIYLISRLRGGMHHISSGRIDYCSVMCPPQENNNENDDENNGHVFINVMRVNYLKKQNNIFVPETITLYYHPKCGMKNIKQILLAETDNEYFNKLSLSKMKRINQQQRELMSKDALMRFTNRYMELINNESNSNE